MRSALIGWMLLVGWVLVSSVSGAQMVPVAVSPGGTVESTRIAEACPTFNWGTVEGATAYELVVLRQAEVAELGAELEVFFQVTLPGSAHGWTPSLERCLERGEVYAWTVRALLGAGVSAWSEASVFEVSRFSAGANQGRLGEHLGDQGGVVQAVAGDVQGAAVDRLRERLREGRGAEAEAPDDEAATEAAKERNHRLKQNLLARREVRLAKRGLPERLATVEGSRSGGLDLSAPAAYAPAAPNPSLTLSNDISLSAASNIFKDGDLLLWDDGSGGRNLATGRQALSSNTTGWANTALGMYALRNNSTGRINTASGVWRQLLFLLNDN